MHVTMIVWMTLSTFYICYYFLSQFVEKLFVMSFGSSCDFLITTIVFYKGTKQISLFQLVVILTLYQLMEYGF